MAERCASWIARAAGVTTTYLKRKLPQQKFLVQSRDPAAIEVSGYDAGAKGYHLVLAGCLACTEPLEIGARHDPRFVTLATPDKGDSQPGGGRSRLQERGGLRRLRRPPRSGPT